jgi:hypothetical protein
MFSDNLYRRATEVMKQSPFGSIELVEGRNDIRFLPVSTKKLTDR